MGKSKAWSAFWIVFRALRCGEMFRSDDWGVWFFAGSEMLCLLVSVRGLMVGKVDSTWAGCLVPVCYAVPMFYHPIGAADERLVVAIIALALFQVGIRFWLGMSVSVGVPVYRRVVSTGPYAIVRHPLASCEVAMVAVLAMAYPTVWNLFVLPVAVGACFLAAMIEERFLWGEKAYREYCGLVKCRFLPFVY